MENDKKSDTNLSCNEVNPALNIAEKMIRFLSSKITFITLGFFTIYMVITSISEMEVKIEKMRVNNYEGALSNYAIILSYMGPGTTLNEFKENGETYELLAVKNSISRINDHYYEACELNDEQKKNVSIVTNDTYDSIFKKRDLYTKYCYKIENKIQERNKKLREQLIPD